MKTCMQSSRHNCPQSESMGLSVNRWGWVRQGPLCRAVLMALSEKRHAGDNRAARAVLTDVLRERSQTREDTEHSHTASSKIWLREEVVWSWGWWWVRRGMRGPCGWRKCSLTSLKQWLHGYICQNSWKMYLMYTGVHIHQESWSIHLLMDMCVCVYIKLNHYAMCLETNLAL